MRERGQTRYQVRFAWGVAGAARVAADAHLLVWVDVLPTVPATDLATLPATGVAPLPAADVAAVLPLLPPGPEVVLGRLGNAASIARRVLTLQAERGDRCVVAVVAAGHVDPDPATPTGPATPPEPAVEDLLAAGAVVDALAAVGIDACSPEAAAACAAATGLRRAVGHLVTASEGAGALDAVGRHDLVEAALAPAPELTVLRPARQREQTRRA